MFADDVDAPPERAVCSLAEAPGLAGRPIVYVPGSHEIYGGSKEDRFAADGNAYAGTRVHLLEGGAVVLAGVRSVGVTLWTDYQLKGDPASAMGACGRTLPDHRRIEVGEPRSRHLLRPRDAAALHAADRAYLEEELGRPCEHPTVVVTHHAPHPGSLPARFAQDRTAPGYASDLGNLIRNGRPALWVHGHVHASADHRVAATRVLSNPRGHERRGRVENALFDPSLVVEVPTGVGLEA